MYVSHIHVWVCYIYIYIYIYIYEPLIEPEQVLSLLIRVELGLMAMKGCSIVPKGPGQDTYHQIV